MKGFAFGSKWLMGVSLVFACTSAWAQLDSCEITESDGYDNCADALGKPSDGNAPYRKECKEVAATRRNELEGWGVAAESLSDIAIFDRYGRELVKRCKADREQARRDALERDRLAAEEAAANAERARIAAQRDKEIDEYGAQQMKAGQEMMNNQNAMLQGLGVNLGATSKVHEDCEEDDYLAEELNMYQLMVDQGAAPECDGLTCAELVDCVDEAMDEEE